MKKLLLLCLLGLLYGFSSAQKPVLTIPSGQNSWLSAYKITPNGKYLVAAAMDRSVKVYDLEAKREVFTFWGHRDFVEAIAISKDNRTVISGDGYGEIIFWDLNSGKILKRDSTTHISNISALNISPDGKKMVSADWKGNVTMWDVNKKDTLYNYDYLNFQITKANFTASGKSVFVSAPDFSKTDTLQNFIMINALTSDVDEAYFFSSALYRSSDISEDEKKIYCITNNPAEIRRMDIASKKSDYKIPLDEGIPIDIMTLDAKNVAIIFCNDKRKATIIVYDMEAQKVLKKIVTTITIPSMVQRNAVLQKYPGKTDVITFISGYSMGVYALDLKTEKLDFLSFKKSSYQSNPILINDQLYLSGEDNIFKKWDFKSNQLTSLYTDTTHLYNIDDFNGKLLLTSYKKWLVWDKKTEKIEKTIEEPDAYNAVHVFVSPDKSLIAVPLNNNQIKIYKQDFTLLKTIDVGFKASPWDELWDSPTTLALTSLKRFRDTVFFYDLNKGLLPEKIASKYTISKFDKISDDVFVAGIDGGILKLFSKATSAVIKQRTLAQTGGFQYLKYDKKLNRIIVSADDGLILFLDPITLETDKSFVGHQSWIVGLDFSEDYSKLYSTSYDNSVKIWDVKTETELTTLSILGGKEWIASGKSNLFDASPEAMKMMYYVVNDTADAADPWKIIELDQLKHRYYQPGLLQIQMGYNKEPFRNVPVLDNIELAPKLKAIVSENNILNVKLKNQKGGIGKVSVFLNNAEVIADARPKKDGNKDFSELEINVDLNQFKNRFLNEDHVSVKVIAWNGGNWISSTPIIISLNLLKSKGVTVTNNDQKSVAEKPRLFALVFGTSDYTGTQIDLRYASKDASDFASALRLSAQKLFGVNDVEVSLFNSDAKEKSLQPEKQNLVNALVNLAKKMKPSDILLIYLSGHGVNFGGADGDFYYLTKDAAGADAAYLADPAVRNNAGVSSAELTNLLNKIAARKKLLVLDACASGKAAETMLASAKDVPASQVRALDRMKDRTGFYILSGSASDAVSYESSVYGQGLLTYSLLKAMRGAALRIDGGEEYIDIQKLFQYAVDEVPKLAAGIGGIQKPLYRSPDNQQSFDIGKSDESTKNAIILAEPKPVFLAVGLQDPLELFDRLNLSDKINAALRENTAKGKSADFVFTEAKDYPGAYKISGTYEQKDDQLILKYVLIKDKVRLGEVKTFSANYKDPSEFASNFINELKSDFKNK